MDVKLDFNDIIYLSYGVNFLFVVAVFFGHCRLLFIHTDIYGRICMEHNCAWPHIAHIAPWCDAAHKLPDESSDSRLTSERTKFLINAHYSVIANSATIPSVFFSFRFARFSSAFLRVC